MATTDTTITTIHDVLDELRAAATSERDKGDMFEDLMVAFLRTDPVWNNRFAEVWKWGDSDSTRRASNSLIGMPKVTMRSRSEEAEWRVTVLCRS